MPMIAFVIWMSALRRRGVAGRVVVDEDQGGCGQFQRPLDHLARIDRRVVHGAGLLHLIGDQLVALVEKEDAKLLLVGKRHATAATGNDVVPRRQCDAAFDLAFGDTPGRGGEQLELCNRGVADAIDFAQQVFRRMHDLGEGAESFQERFGERFGVAPWQRGKQRQFQ
jgi:hypothetical protein